MSSIVKFCKTDPAIGLSMRKPTAGPELEFVQEFISTVTNVMRTPSTEMAVFYEPRLDTGFPDIVFVRYESKMFEHWNSKRLSLATTDLKILHHMYLFGLVDDGELKKTLGFGQKVINDSLERLNDSKLICRYREKWRVIDVNKSFAVRDIIAVEAKMKGWSSVLQQAQNNTWFASESYVLSPVDKPSDRILTMAAHLGVGIFTFSKRNINKLVSAVSTNLPGCYASWLFNEWIGRYLYSYNKDEENYAFSYCG